MHFPSCRVWDVNDGSLVNRLDYHSGTVFCVRFNSDTLVTGSLVLCIVYLLYMTLYSSSIQSCNLVKDRI